MEPRQQQFVQFLPDPGGLPVAQSSPAGHAAAPKLRGQILPRDAGAQDEEDAFKTGAIVARLAAGMALSPRFDGNERFDQRPQFVIQQWLGHGCASLHHMAKSNPRAIVLGVLRQKSNAPFGANFTGAVVHFTDLVRPKSSREYSSGP